MNETKNIIVGLELGSKTSQLCYYDRKEKEPISLSPKVGSNQYPFPTSLSKKPGEDVWHLGLEAEYFASQQGEIMIDDFFGILNQEEEVLVDGQLTEPYKVAGAYLKETMKLLGVSDLVRQVSALMITTEQLTQAMVHNLQRACEEIGFSRKRCFLQDFEESFFCYVLNQKAEYWSRKVAWFTFDRDQVSFAQLVIDQKTKPMIVRILRGRTIQLSEDPAERDLEFYQLIHESFGTDNYSSIYIVGEGFDKEWAVRSVPLLCKNRRHVFYGNNLFVKGACYGAREKVEERNLKNYLFSGQGLIKSNIGMEMAVQGSQAYYPIIEAGNNWYECIREFEIILDNTEELTFLVNPMEGKIRTRYSMKLPGLPKRPNKTTRLQIRVEYESASVCVITVTDMGFGEMFPASGQVWTEKVSW